LDIDKSDKPGGFWTPASALAEPLIVRLQQDAGMVFGVVQV
jgi:short subunit dehydrogenase-like uncharacterized protein